MAESQYSYGAKGTAPTAETLFLLVLSILALEPANSIRFLYRHFLSGITQKSLNAFYYACSYAKVDYSRFMNVPAAMVLKLVPECLKSQPVFLCIDDTMVAKFRKKFKDVSKLFDHVAHNGSYYQNGHCFVSFMLCVPVWQKQRIVYLATNMVRQVMPDLSSQKNVILIRDHWYAKKELACVVDEYANLDIICNARHNSVLYGLAPQPTSKRGRLARHVKCLSLKEDFTLSDEKIGDYYIGMRWVLANLFRQGEVLAYVTAPEKIQGARHLFFSIIFPHQMQIFYAWQGKAPLNQTRNSRMQYPFAVLLFQVEH